MEGNLQLLYVLLTDCYVYLLRKGAYRPRQGWVGLRSFPPPPPPPPWAEHTVFLLHCHCRARRGSSLHTGAGS